MHTLFDLGKQYSPRLQWVRNNGIKEHPPTKKEPYYSAKWGEGEATVEGRSTVSAEDACLALIEKSQGGLLHWNAPGFKQP